MEPNLRHRVILGAFVFYPLWSNHHVKGMKAGHIYKVSPRTFHTLFKTSESVPTPALGVSSLCNQMVRLGWLQRVGTVDSVWLSTRTTRKFAFGDEVMQHSPIYAPTEAGMLYALTVLNTDALPDVKGLFVHKRISSNVYENKHALTDEDHAFRDYVLYNAEEAYQLKFYNAGRIRTRKWPAPKPVLESS